MVNRFLPKLILILLAVNIASCVIDDTSPNPSLPLPFDDFEAFFELNRLEKDTFPVNANGGNNVGGDGVNYVFQANSFSSNGQLAEGEVEIVVKKMIDKSEIILRDLPTVSDASVLEFAGGIFFEPIQDEQSLDIDSAVIIELPLPNILSSTTGFSLFQYDGAWMDLGQSVSIDEENDKLEIENKNKGWLAGAHMLDFAEVTAMTSIPLGLPANLVDLKGYIVLSEKNTVIGMSSDINALSLNQNEIPKGEEATIVIMAMTKFDLYLGMQTTEISSNLSLDVDMQEVTETEFITMLKTLDE